MSASVELRAGTSADLPRLRDLLAGSGLPVDDLDLSRQHFLTATLGDEVVACAAVEPCGADALLRSVAVRADLRDRGVGDLLCRRALDLARAHGARAVWLLTTTADGWFARRGFEAADRAGAPPRIAATSEFRSTCPASARCLRLAL